MSFVVNIIADGETHLVGSTLYGYCETPAGTAAKVVGRGADGNELTDFDALIAGTTVHIKFKYSNTAANATLQVGNTDAKSIYAYHNVSPGNTTLTSWEAGSVISFTYDGTAWRMNDPVYSVGAKVEAVETDLYSKAITPTADLYLPSAPGSTYTYDMPGITSDHVLVHWGFSLLAENAPGAKLECNTYNGYFTVKNWGGIMLDVFRPVFVVPVKKAASQRT